jgi:peptide-methionine (S)-S-oxide reductase
MEGPFESLPGVISVLSGYTGGSRQKPSYEEVSAGTTGHAEAVQVLYDPGRMTYERLLETYWHNIDPLNARGQFCDHGSQYRPVIFVHDATQRAAAERSLQELAASGRLPGPIVVPIEAASTFYPAEDYHQDFYKTNPVRYQSYRAGCGRDRRLRELWGAQAGGHR